jgi:predicted NUDIX family NTP pyrophosphohydrolase
MKKYSAGILTYKTNDDGQLAVLLVHPGGPFWVKKDLGAWSVPKGEHEPDEEPLVAAKREYREETGQPLPNGEYIDLGETKLKDGKTVSVWAAQGEVNLSTVISNKFEMEWPPHSGQRQSFPEIDRADWFSLDEAAAKLSSGQAVFLSRLAEKLGVKAPSLPEQQHLL